MRTTALLVAAATLALTCVSCAAPTKLVEGEGTTFVIYHAADAPPSVARAAVDLQDYLYRAAKAKLAIVNDPAEPMICLGDNSSAQAAGIAVADMPLEGFRILTAGGSIYIAGPDTADGERTLHGGTSNGTANGVYSFLEQFVGVRWLDPTEHGDYVPTTADITIPDTDISDAPFFLNRRVPYTQQDRDVVMRWWGRQKLGHSLFLSHGHNWRRTIPAENFDAHPEWFAERGGKRIPPTGRYKLCVTDEGLIAEYARRAIEYFDANPNGTCYSLSPSDSAGWCDCEDCTALYEDDPNGNLSVTPAIVNFYNEVGKIVGEKHPDKILAGYVYAAYVFPPSTPIPLEPNVFLVWTPSFDYGYTLHRPELQEQWDDLLAQWTEITDNISYYDLPVNISTEAGALNPPGLNILSFMYPRLKEANIKGVYVYGISAWGRAAPLNYILARLAWDPDVDVDALLTEYCAKAYAEGGPEIEEMWRLLDAEVERHFIEFPNARYTLTTDMMTDIYVKNLPEIERLYRSAEAKVTDEDAAARLGMIGENLTVLAWNLRQFKLLPDPEATSFYMADVDFFEFLSARRGSLALAPRKESQSASKLANSVMVAPADEVPGAEAVGRYLLRGDQHVVIYPTGAGKVSVSFSQVSARGKLVSWLVVGADGAEVASGLMSTEVPIELDAEGSAHYHLIVSAGSASFKMAVDGGAWAVDGMLSDQGLHFLGALSPVYFEVPAGVDAFHIGLGAGPPGETAIATLFAPDGREVETFDCTEMPLDRKLITVGAGDAGWWKMVVTEAGTGVLDDVWIKPESELSGFICIDAARALSVRKVQ